tara:strand:- start:309 stop:575 length:267 start_codon:yes stop_codon:yes gene_type:complete
MKEVYFILRSLDYSESLGEEIRKRSGAANTFKAAYNAALSIGEIRNPNIGYKAALERVRTSNIVTIKEAGWSDYNVPSDVIITRIKKY